MYSDERSLFGNEGSKLVFVENRSSVLVEWRSFQSEHLTEEHEKHLGDEEENALVHDRTQPVEYF